MDAFAKARVGGNVDNMEAMLTGNVPHRIEQNGLPDAAHSRNARKPVGRPGPVFERIAEVVENRITPDKLGRIHAGSWLERIFAFGCHGAANLECEF